MMLKMIDQKIRDAFSSSAMQYDVLTSLHKEIGRELTKKLLDNENTKQILDVGMGTGWMTHRLKYFLPESRIIGMDFADGMIDQAKTKYDDITILQADARDLPFKADVFDLIISNLAYQWIRKLPSAFGECHRALRKDGKIYLTMFGYETFRELFETFNTVIASNKDEQVLTINRLANRDQVSGAMKEAGFRDIHIDYERIKIRFNDMVGLVKWIKDIGANCLGNSVYLGKDLFEEANQYYERNYKDRLGVYSTLEVIWVWAKK